MQTCKLTKGTLSVWVNPHRQAATPPTVGPDPRAASRGTDLERVSLSLGRVRAILCLRPECSGHDLPETEVAPTASAFSDSGSARKHRLRRETSTPFVQSYAVGVGATARRRTDLNTCASEPASCAAQTSCTQPRNQPCAGSASRRGCQSNEMVISGIVSGSGKLCMPVRSIPVCRSGTLATRSEARARASAVEKPATIVAITRCNPNGFNASSIGPLSRPCRET